MNLLKQFGGQPSHYRPAPRDAVMVTAPHPDAAKDGWDLNRVMLKLADSPIDLASFYEGFLINGGIGSGKSSGSGATIIRSFMKSGMGGYWFIPHPGEVEALKEYAEEAGRSEDVILIEPGGQWVFNPLDYEVSREGVGAGSVENLVQLIGTMAELADKPDSNREGGDFWVRSMKMMLRNVLDMLLLAKERITIDNICKVIAEAPQSLEQTKDREWGADSYCIECLLQAQQNTVTPQDQHTLTIITRYFLKEFPAMSDRTRSSVVVTFTSIADMFQHGVIHELFGGETNVTPEMAFEQGKIIAVTLLIQSFYETGKIAQGLFKYLYQRAVLRRDVTKYPQGCFLIADECQHILTSYDALYMAEVRKNRCATLFLTQNINNVLAAIGNEASAHALMGMFQTKIWHAQSDPKTNEWASNLIGQKFQTTFHYNASGDGMGSAGGSEALHPQVLPSEFNSLRKGGVQNQLEVDAIIYQGGRIWGNGKTYLRTVFKQQ